MLVPRADLQQVTRQAHAVHQAHLESVPRRQTRFSSERFQICGLPSGEGAQHLRVGSQMGDGDPDGPRWIGKTRKAPLPPTWTKASTQRAAETARARVVGAASTSTTGRQRQRIPWSALALRDDGANNNGGRNDKGTDVKGNHDGWRAASSRSLEPSVTRRRSPLGMEQEG